jgi:hypothetical protein
MLYAKAFSKKTRLVENEGFGVTRRTPRHLAVTLRRRADRQRFRLRTVQFKKYNAV